MKRILLLALTLLLSSPFLAAARGLPLPSPDPDRGTLAVTLRSKAPLGPAASAVQVYFVRLDEGAEVLDAHRVIPSNFGAKRQVYLLNCEPGRYAVVGGELPSHGTRMEYKVFLDREAIAATEIVVEPGTVTFMGEVLVKARVKINRADTAQSHFLRLLEPEMARRGYMARTFLGSALYLGDLRRVDRSPGKERRFFDVAERKVFKKHPEWQRVVRAHASSPHR